MLRTNVLNGECIRQEIAERGYAEVKQLITDEDLLTAVEAYTHFTLNHPDPLPSTMDAMLPINNEGINKQLDELNYDQDTQSDWHKYRTNTAGVGKPDGYTNRTYQKTVLQQVRSLEIVEDSKEFYHYTPRHLANMQRRHADRGWGSIPSEVFKLDEAMSNIHEKASKLLLSVLATIEEVHPEVTNQVTPTTLLGSPLRLLFYHNKPIDTQPSCGNESTEYSVIAGGHYDKGFATIQIGESHEGLEIAPHKDAPLTHVVRDASKAIFFSAERLSELFGHGESFHKAWHRVVDSERINPDRSVPTLAKEVCKRWSFVLFSHCEKMTFPDKALMHTR